ncbi:TPA: fimbrial protein [Salmonella enterica subsp. enterica serovar Teltow]|uniref:Fimbrial protein n=12 Tax=Enterobacteriaceae TaxID=543 RepID=A0A3U9W406_SALET|nr:MULTISPECIES: fimbrial protein [Enterobacteriaceae]EAA1044030.1 fimbrial protein [Salmonella enterica subsp. enterica serovar Westeinde]EAA1509347.1 fimbrial protein [Salmonella enterica subsp. enterica serovar Agama]EAA2459923.1 fimbrial protein [Salmonella enterica subsp. enterica serovar Durham]EAA2653075.1 fimbrial protein [Salmonella enterica subsp. enterica serovar Colorado]EAA3086057.1 fimbrial protein [Salmonella enterica subsp. enterica serovar Telelkebir]EAA5204740.1 fimbrial pro
MKLKLIALSLVLSAASTTSAFALDGGQVDFAGLVSDNTCTPHVNGGSQDGQVQLNTAVTANVASDPGVQGSEPGVQPEPFYITVDCGSSNANTKAHLSMASTFFSNSLGTLNNDDSISNPATGVNLAIHQVDDSGSALAYTQVKVNDAADIHDASFNADGVAKFNFVVSYVKQSDAVPVTAGYVKSNTAYTVTYE